MLVDRRTGNSNAELCAELAQWYISILSELLPGPPFALVQAPVYGAGTKDQCLQERRSDVAQGKLLVGADRLMPAVALENGETASGPEDVGELDGRLRAATTYCTQRQRGPYRDSERTLVLLGTDSVPATGSGSVGGTRQPPQRGVVTCPVVQRYA